MSDKIVHMTKKKSSKPDSGIKQSMYRFPKNPYGAHHESEMAWTCKLIKSKRLTPDKLTVIDAKGTLDLTRFRIIFSIVSDPLHPKNNWRSAVAKAKRGGEECFRLASAISIPAMKYWKAHGHPPPYEWAIFDSKVKSAGSSNPYPPASRPHAVFEMASDWIAPSELLDRISQMPKVNRRHASSLLHNIGSVTRKQNNGRSHLEEKIVAGVKMVRAVPGPA